MGKTILAIDDEKDFLEVLGAWLQEKGYTVRTASTIEAALESIDSHLPNLILLDIIMPEVDGFQVLETLKKGGKTRDLPVIMLSAKIDTDAIMRAQELQASDFIPKPFDPKELLQSIRKYER